MVFDGVSGLVRVVVVGIVAYGALVTFLRISGKRTLSKMNAFDLVVTVALGSTLATVVLSKDIALAEGVLALALLIALQWSVAWGSSRSKRLSQLVKSEPQVLYHRGQHDRGRIAPRARRARRDHGCGAQQRLCRPLGSRNGGPGNRWDIQRHRPAQPVRPVAAAKKPRGSSDDGALPTQFLAHPFGRHSYDCRTALAPPVLCIRLRPGRSPSRWGSPGSCCGLHGYH
jgi:hypothetical protein